MKFKLEAYSFITTALIIPWIGKAAEYAMQGNWITAIAIIFAPIFLIFGTISAIKRTIKRAIFKERHPL